MNSLKRIERRRMRLRKKIRKNQAKCSWYRPRLRARKARWQAEYERLGMIWAQQRKAAGLDLTNAILLNDEGERISSSEFKKIANQKVMGDNADEVYIKAKYDYSDGRVVPASEVFDDPYTDYPFKIYKTNKDTKL